MIDPSSSASNITTLNNMAEAGGKARSDNPVGTKFYLANTQTELVAALGAITGQVVSCTFDFEKQPPDPTNIAVKVNGVAAPEDASKADGWAYTSADHMGVELFGSWCQQVKDATENKVDIIFGCKGEPIK